MKNEGLCMSTSKLIIWREGMGLHHVVNFCVSAVGVDAGAHFVHLCGLLCAYCAYASIGNAC